MRADSPTERPAWLGVLDSALPGDEPARVDSSASSTPVTGVEDRLSAVRRERYGGFRFTELSTRETDGYLRLLEALVRATPWGREMPDSTMLADQVAGLRVLEAHGLLDQRAQINASTGLPSRVLMQLVSSTRAHLLEYAEKGSTHRAIQHGDAFATTQLRTLEALRRLEPSTLGEVKARTVDLDMTRGNRTLIAHRDRYVSPGVVQRISIEIRRPLEEKRSLAQWLRREKASVSRDGGEWSFGDQFSGFLERYASVDLNRLALLLHDRYGTDFLRVSRGTVGPIWFDGGDAPEAIDEVLARQPGSAIATFELDRITPQPGTLESELRVNRARRERWLTSANLRDEHDALRDIAESANTDLELRAL